MMIRVYLLSQKIWYPLFCGGLCLVQLGGGFAMFVLTLKSNAMLEIGSKHIWILYITLASAAIVDICNTVSLTVLLAQYS